MKLVNGHKKNAYKLFFGTLGNESRLEILTALRKKSLNVTEIVDVTGLQQSLVSHNLKRLEHCGFVFREVRGKYRYYSLNKDTIKPLIEIIDNHMREFCEKIVVGERK
jgi:ArsR family transcriptional regulator, cadmium/lead-responsive transcriptional repressor